MRFRLIEETKKTWTPKDVEIYVMKKFGYRINDDNDRAFILPNGDFLSTDRDAHIHIEHSIQDYLAKNFDIENFKHSMLDHPVTDMCGWIRVNGVNENYICLSSIKPTIEQYNALIKWLDSFIELEDYIKIVSYDGKEQQTYDFNEYTVDDVIKKIKRYYASGKLYESLEELSNEYDSEGNQLTKAQAEFFKNSKVRDNKGRLLVCYHGTDKEFDIFAKNKIKTGTFGNGFYFTTQKYSGDSYGRYNKKYYLNIKNCINIPIEYEDITEFVSDKFFNDKYNARMIDNQHATDILREKSFDGISVAMYNDWGEFEYYVVFEPNQIKSITNKSPTNSDNINENK